MKRICVVFGTRPEAIKLAPVVRALNALSEQGHALEVRVCVTAQHRRMLDQVLTLFNMTPHYDLDIMRSGQDLSDIMSRVLTGMRGVLRDFSPNLVLVQGDTTTTFAASLASFYEQIPVAHVEAGLRTGNVYSPWPEELNRRVTGMIASLHFAPTQDAHFNLVREGVDPSTIHITGNTVIDSLLSVAKRLETDVPLRQSLEVQFSYLNASKRLLLVTGHRRESFGRGFENICHALKTLCARSDVEILYPVHLNPNVREPVCRLLGYQKAIHLIDPVDYISFVYLMTRACLVLTDSGGIQEEGPSLGKPVLVMRDTTERPEGVEAGTVKLVGTDEETIVRTVNTLLDDPTTYQRMATATNPYGDGHSAERIAAVIAEGF